MRTVHVDLGDRSYPVLVGHGAMSELASLVPATARKVAVVTQAEIPVTVDPGVEYRTFEIASGEAGKDLATIGDLCRQWAQWGLNRNDCIVGVGGGVVTDVAGFAASVYHRGLPVVHVSTTLLGMVDAATGGKTGVNLPEGKNLVGTFWQPSGVICDLDTLISLPPRELLCGRGEMAKYHFLTGDNFEEMDLEERVATCVKIKADVVAADEREGSAHGVGRAILNYGHTLAHAIETAGNYQLRHGEAVAIGLIYAAELAHRLGRISQSRVDEHRAVVAAYDLVGQVPADLDSDVLIDLFGSDKKALTGTTFVLDSGDGMQLVQGIERSILRDVMELVR